MTVALMLLRLKALESRAWKYGLLSMLIALIVGAILVSVTDLVTCRPISSNWDVLNYTADCWPKGTSLITQYCYSGKISVSVLDQSNI